MEPMAISKSLDFPILISKEILYWRLAGPTYPMYAGCIRQHIWCLSCLALALILSSRMGFLTNVLDSRVRLFLTLARTWGSVICSCDNWLWIANMHNNGPIFWKILLCLKNLMCALRFAHTSVQINPPNGNPGSTPVNLSSHLHNYIHFNMRYESFLGT